MADRGKDDHAEGEDRVSESQEVPNNLSSETTMPRQRFLRTMVGTYFAAQRSTLQFVSRTNKQQYSKMIPYVWKRNVALNTRDIVWREDMDTYVLELLRKELLKDLKYLSSKPSGYIASSTYQKVGAHSQLSAALWPGAGNAKSSISVEGTGTDGETGIPFGSAGPPAYAMLDYRRTSIPFFNLQTLLGNKFLKQLRDSSPSFQSEIVVVRSRRHTLKIQMALWKLMGYLAEGV